MEVRSKEEILKSLGANGRLEELPFGLMDMRRVRDRSSQTDGRE